MGRVNVLLKDKNTDRVISINFGAGNTIAFCNIHNHIIDYTSKEEHENYILYHLKSGSTYLWDLVAAKESHILLNFEPKSIKDIKPYTDIKLKDSTIFSEWLEKGKLDNVWKLFFNIDSCVLEFFDKNGKLTYVTNMRLLNSNIITWIKAINKTVFYDVVNNKLIIDNQNNYILNSNDVSGLWSAILYMQPNEFSKNLLAHIVVDYNELKNLLVNFFNTYVKVNILDSEKVRDINIQLKDYIIDRKKVKAINNKVYYKYGYLLIKETGKICGLDITQQKIDDYVYNDKLFSITDELKSKFIEGIAKYTLLNKGCYVIIYLNEGLNIVDFSLIVEKWYR